NWPPELFNLTMIKGRQRGPAWLDGLRLKVPENLSDIIGEQNYLVNLSGVVDKLADVVSEWVPAPGPYSDSAQLVLRSQNSTSRRMQFIRSFWYNLNESPNFRHLYDIIMQPPETDFADFDEVTFQARFEAIFPAKPFVRSA